MEWQVVGVIIALVGLVTGIAAPILKLNTSIVRLDSTMKASTKELDKIDRENHTAHERMYGRIGDCERAIERHEAALDSHSRRIEKLEEKE